MSALSSPDGIEYVCTCPDRERLPRLYGAEAAAYVGVAASTWRTAVKRQVPPSNPPPRECGTVADREHGMLRRFWHAVRLDAYLANRPGRGVGGGRPRNTAR